MARQRQRAGALPLIERSVVRFGPGTAKVSSQKVFDSAQTRLLKSTVRKPSNAPRAFADPRSSAGSVERLQPVSGLVVAASNGGVVGIDACGEVAVVVAVEMVMIVGEGRVKHPLHASILKEHVMQA